VSETPRAVRDDQRRARVARESRDARAIREPARVDDAALTLVREHGAAELDDGDARHARSVASRATSRRR